MRERHDRAAAVPHDDYLRVNLACDAMLDTLHWSGGNTTLDALACGLPVVTLPGAFMRGRQSAAMLRAVGADDLIAARRRRLPCRSPRVSSTIAPGVRAWPKRFAAGSARLFDRPEPVQAFARVAARIAVMRYPWRKASLTSSITVCQSPIVGLPE